MGNKLENLSNALVDFSSEHFNSLTISERTAIAKVLNAIDVVRESEDIAIIIDVPFEEIEIKRL